MTDDRDISCNNEYVYGESVSPKLRFVDLTQGNHEVLIEYQGQVYRLIATKNGRLVLNK